MHSTTTTTHTQGTASAEDGQAMVEFALVLFPLCLVLFAIVEFGMAFWTYQQVSAAASEGARRASVSRTFSDRTTRTQDAAKAASPMLTKSKMNVTVTSTWQPGAEVSVEVTYPEEITVLGIPFFNSNLVGKRTMRVEQ